MQPTFWDNDSFTCISYFTGLCTAKQMPGQLYLDNKYPDSDSDSEVPWSPLGTQQVYIPLAAGLSGTLSCNPVQQELVSERVKDPYI